ncbi:hypothetical protein R4036_004566 [Salmonella enterica]|nr:hypothetical protein [Salmonella enterica]
MSLSIIAAIRLLREDGGDLDALHEAEAIAGAYIRAHGLDHYRFLYAPPPPPPPPLPAAAPRDPAISPTGKKLLRRVDGPTYRWQQNRPAR